MEDNNGRGELLKYINTILLSVLTLVLSYGVGSLVNMHNKLDSLIIKQATEEVQRHNNSQLILDHEGRIKSLEKDMREHEDEIKEWVDKSYQRKIR